MPNAIYLREDQILTLVAMIGSEIAEINKQLVLKGSDFADASRLEMQQDYLRGIMARLMYQER